MPENQHANEATARQTWIYAIGEPGKSIIKIGMSVDVNRRLYALNTNNHMWLEVLWQTPGNWALEQQLHIALARFRVKGEWYDFGTEDGVKLIQEAATARRPQEPATVDAPTKQTRLAGSKPAYVQVAELLRARIANGTYRANNKLPSNNDLRAEFGVAPGTIHKAIDLLRAEGLIEGQVGRGIYIRTDHADG